MQSRRSDPPPASFDLGSFEDILSDFEADGASDQFEEVVDGPPDPGATAAPETRSPPLRQVAAGEISAQASIVSVDPGFYAVRPDMSESTTSDGVESGGSTEPFPGVQVTALPTEGAGSIVLRTVSSTQGPLLCKAADTVLVKVAGEAVRLMLTTYWRNAYDRPTAARITRLNGDPFDLVVGTAAPETPAPMSAARRTAPTGRPIRTEILLHIQQLGDQRFTAEGWAGRIGQRLRIEALAVRPLERLRLRDIEYKVLTPATRDSEWVSNGELCGTWGRGLPITGFAVRPAAGIRVRCDVEYEGSFFQSGVIGPCRNGEMCLPTIPGDPLAAVNIRILVGDE